MHLFLTSNIIFSLSISLLSVKESENYIYKREERDRERERVRQGQQERECLNRYERNCRKICRFIRIQSLFIFYFHKCIFKAQILSVNTAEEYQSHLVLKLLLFSMKNTTCNQIRGEFMISSSPHISKELHTYFPLLLLQYTSFYLLLLRSYNVVFYVAFP